MRLLKEIKLPFIINDPEDECFYLNGDCFREDITNEKMLGDEKILKLKEVYAEKNYSRSVIYVAYVKTDKNNYLMHLIIPSWSCGDSVGVEKDMNRVYSIYDGFSDSEIQEIIKSKKKLNEIINNM